MCSSPIGPTRLQVRHEANSRRSAAGGNLHPNRDNTLAAESTHWDTWEDIFKLRAVPTRCRVVGTTLPGYARKMSESIAHVD